MFWRHLNCHLLHVWRVKGIPWSTIFMCWFCPITGVCLYKDDMYFLLKAGATGYEKVFTLLHAG